MKKLFALIVAICATTLAWADESGSCGENVTYSFVSSTGTLTISGTGDMNDYVLASQAPWYYLSIEKVVITYGVTSIGDYAFSECTELTSVTIPNSVTSIGSGAFGICTGLTSVTIPNSVTSIGDWAFYGCSGLTSVTIGNGVTSIGSGAFQYCSGLTSVTIPNSVTSIGLGAFDGCTGLTSVTIPNSVTSIGEEAFYECTGLISVTILNSVTSIGGLAFYECTGLTSVTIPNSVTSIGSSAFDGCTGLTSMTVEATNPPSYSSTDNMVPNYNIPLYVPAGSVDAYKAADEWKKFTNIQAIPATGVNEAAAEKSAMKKIIDRNGIIYIEKDGTRYFLNGDKVE